MKRGSESSLQLVTIAAIGTLCFLMLSQIWTILFEPEIDPQKLLLSYIVLTLLTFLVALYLFYKLLRTPFRQFLIYAFNLREMTEGFKRTIALSEQLGDYMDQKSRIVIMMPMTSVDPHFKKEVGAALKGVGRALKDRRGVLVKAHFIFKDHMNDPIRAKQIIEEELVLGSRYFIVTMSEVCKKLASHDENSSLHFNHITKKYEESHGPARIKPILICTLAASKDLVLQGRKNIFRIYIKNTNEVERVADKITDMIDRGEPERPTNLCVISVNNEDHSYFMEAESKLKEYWGPRQDEKINTYFINRESEDIINFNQEEIRNISSAHIIFVLANFNWNKRIIREILDKKLFNDKGFKLITTSIFPTIYKEVGYSMDSKSKLVKSILQNDKVEWLVSRPVKIIGNQSSGSPFYGELSEFCMNISLQKMIAVITHQEYNGENFFKIWSSDDIKKIPSKEKFSFDYDRVPNDPTIKTQIINVKRQSV